MNGKILRELRRKLGFSQDELAARAGISKSGLSGIEQAARAAMTIKNFRKLAEALGRTPEELRLEMAGLKISTADLRCLVDWFNKRPEADRAAILSGSALVRIVPVARISGRDARGRPDVQARSRQPGTSPQ